MDQAHGFAVAGVRRVAGPGARPFRIASLTKPFTAVATVLAARAAGVGLDRPAFDLLPGLRADWAADTSITIADLLSQTSGLAAAVTADQVRALGDSDEVALEAARLVVRAGSARAPGGRWQYDNGNYFLAGAVLAALAGSSYEDAVAGLVLRPWGLEATTFDPPPDLVPGTEGGRRLGPVPYPRGRRPSGGLCSTVEDLLTFGEHLLADRGLLDEVRTPRTADPLRYGLGWAVGPSGQLFLNGRLPGYRGAMLLVPDHDLVGVGLAARSEALPHLAGTLSDGQRDLTGDDLTEAIDTFAA